MTSIGQQAREEAARSQGLGPPITGIQPEKTADGVEAQPDGPAKKPLANENDPKQPGHDVESQPGNSAPKQRASTIVAAAANKTLHVGPISRNVPGRPVHDLAHEIIGSQNPGIEGNEADLTEKDTIKTTTKMAKFALGMPLGALALAAQHEHSSRLEADQKAPNLKDGAKGEQPTFVDRIKAAYQEGVTSGSPQSDAVQNPPKLGAAQPRPSRRSGMEID